MPHEAFPIEFAFPVRLYISSHTYVKVSLISHKYTYILLAESNSLFIIDVPFPPVAQPFYRNLFYDTCAFKANAKVGLIHI